MLSLEDFVAESLRQVIAGVTRAQTATKDTGVEINPSAIVPNAAAVDVILRRGGGMVERVTFDVAVTTVETADKKAGIGVFAGAVAVGGQGQTTATSQATAGSSFPFL